MDVPWRRFIGALAFSLLPTVAIFRRELVSGERNLLAMAVVLLLMFLVAYRAWPALGLAGSRRQKQPGP